MTIKKSLLAVATASTVAVAGAGVANAEDLNTGTEDATGTWGSGISSTELSSEAGTIFGSSSGEGENITITDSYRALLNIALAGGAVAGSIAVLPAIYSATKDFQAYVDEFTADTQAFINSFTN